MYIFSGLILWFFCLVLTYFAPKIFVKFHSNPVNNPNRGQEIADEFVRDLYREFERNTVPSMFWAGVISVVIIGFWPLILMVLGIISIVGLIGGVPYLLIRKMKSSVKEPDEFVPNKRGR